MSLHLREKSLTLLDKSVAGSRRFEEALGASKTRLQKLLALSRDAAISTKAKIVRQVSLELAGVAADLQRAENALVRLRKNVADKPRRLQEGLRARENDLRKLLVSSPDAIIVTNVDRGFVDANPKALDLFGVSEANMRKFTVDIFLSCGRVSEFVTGITVSPFRKRNARCGKCEVRRLDGSLRVAEYQFFANFAPSRHVYRFRNVVERNQYVPPTLRIRVPTRSARQINK
jgi:PAS domain S-box-containing protein